MSEILSFDPFFAEYYSLYNGYTSYTFTCPFCGGHSVRRSIYDDPDDRYFFQGHFRCKTCNKGSFKGVPFVYYSDAFISHRSEIVEQLTLF